MEKADNLIERLKTMEPMFYRNRNVKKGDEVFSNTDLTYEDILDAEERLNRFAPLIRKYFSDTEKTEGIIESPLRRIEYMEKHFKDNYSFKGKLYLKMDSHLPVAGSIKARGGIYEVLYHAEKLALNNGLITLSDDYTKLSNDKCREFFSQYKIHVGSTGNLGLSIGITSATLGFNVIVHMSRDAKEWKKALLRKKGATVIEYDGDFTKAVSEGRKKSKEEENSYFIDDENSVSLFLGYAVAALRLKKQIEEMGIKVDEHHPAMFYLPCGVGGSPGGIAFGVKKVFKDAAHVFFIEPTHCPSMLLGMATGKHNDISVLDIGLDGITEADGLAVGRPSRFIGKVMEPLLGGIFTIEDKDLFNYMRLLDKLEDIRIEPSACSTFQGPLKIFTLKESISYIEENIGENYRDNILHFAWATGGNLVPEDIMKKYLETYL